MIRVCFVCLGNICRSPTAEGVMLHLLEQHGLSHAVEVDSAGTAAYHTGSRPDERSLRAASKRGIQLPGRARQFQAEDFARFDYVLALDDSNFADLKRLAKGKHAERLFLLRDFDPAGAKGASVPDPYYGGEDGFETVLDLCHAACTGLIRHLREHHGPLR